MSIQCLHVLAAVVLIAAQTSACTSRADARDEVAPSRPVAAAMPEPQAPLDERPVTPFETVGASCARTQC